MIGHELHLTLKAKLDEKNEQVLRSILVQDNPKLLAKFDANQCSISELIKIQTTIDLHRNLVKNNVYIAIRLAGGVSLFSRKAKYPITDIENLLKTENYSPLITSLSAVVGKSFEWFEEGRVFYTERQLSQFRKINLGILLSCVENHADFISELKPLLSPCHTYLTDVLAGKNCAHSARICRQIEECLDVNNGMLDLNIAKFEAHFQSMMQS